MLSSPAASASSFLSGDYIGLESCVDLRDNEEELSSRNEGGGGAERRGRRDRRWEMKTKKKEFPPPIPWLAQTENLLSHMPWVMKRYHTSDGRLIIREEKVKRHEYFRAHRANGRLTLHLIPMDGDFYGEENMKGEAEEDDDVNAENENVDEENGEEEEEEKESIKSSCVEINGEVGTGGGGGGGGGGAKCYMRSISSCMFEMAVAAMKPVPI